MAEHAAMEAENMVDDEAVEAEVDGMRVINTIITFVLYPSSSGRG